MEVSAVAGRDPTVGAVIGGMVVQTTKKKELTEINQQYIVTLTWHNTRAKIF